jgi:F420-dependent oxidoreductase-like protein
LTAPSSSAAAPLRYGAFAPQGWKLEYTGWSAADAWARTVELAQLAERVGYDHLWVYDHVETVPRREPTHCFEAFTMLAALSQVTERAELGQMVTCASYRNVGLLAKEAACVDVFSGGRLVLGIGAGWYEREHLGLGVPFPPVSERFERLEETLQIAQQMWSGVVRPYEGKHYQLAETLCQPMPLSTPRPRIMIGGGGEQKTLRLVARYADACNLFAMPGEEGLSTLSHKLDVLRVHCEAVGRPFEAIEKTVIGPAPSRAEHPRAMSPDVVPAFVEQLEGLGIDHYIVPIIDRGSLDTLLNEVLGRFALTDA